jgi:hypothetical protein
VVELTPYMLESFSHGATIVLPNPNAGHQSVPAKSRCRSRSLSFARPARGRAIIHSKLRRNRRCRSLGPCAGEGRRMDRRNQYARSGEGSPRFARSTTSTTLDRCACLPASRVWRLATLGPYARTATVQRGACASGSILRTCQSLSIEGYVIPIDNGAGAQLVFARPGTGPDDDRETQDDT